MRNASFVVGTHPNLLSSLRLLSSSSPPIPSPFFFFVFFIFVFPLTFLYFACFFPALYRSAQLRQVTHDRIERERKHAIICAHTRNVQTHADTCTLNTAGEKRERMHTQTQRVPRNYEKHQDENGNASLHWIRTRSVRSVRKVSEKYRIEILVFFFFKVECAMCAGSRYFVITHTRAKTQQTQGL